MRTFLSTCWAAHPVRTLGGTTTATASGGVATFDDLTLGRVGSPYQIQASSAGLVGATTADLSVTPAAPTHLVITLQPPASVTAGSGFGLGVSVEDAFGNPVTGYGGGVTVTLEGGPAGSSLLGTSSEQASQGVATFSGLTIDRAGGDFVLKVVAEGVGSLSTSTFQVVPAAPSRLVIVDEPASRTVAGQSFGFTAAVEDPYGNVSTGFGGTVTATLASNPAGGSLSGPASANAVNGVVTFTAMALNRAGAGYEVEASSDGLSSTATTPITVSASAPVRLVITTQPSGTVAARRSSRSVSRLWMLSAIWRPASAAPWWRRSRRISIITRCAERFRSRRAAARPYSPTRA